MRQHKRPSPKLALALLAAGLAALALPGLPAEPPPADAGLMVSNLGAPPEWRQKGWGRMSVSAQRYMAQSRTIQIPGFLKTIWANEIAANDKKYADENIVGPGGGSLLGKDGHAPARALWSVYKDGERTVIVSMLDTAKFCEDGPGDAASTQIHSLCPIRITVVQGQSVKNADYPEGCFLDITFGNPPGGPDPTTNASLTRYDIKGGFAELMALRDGKPLPECARHLALPK